jgi:hypothetical protein
MTYTNQPTIVSNVLICVDYKVLAEMTDGSIVELSTPWGCPSESTINGWSSLGWRFRTHAQLIELARSHNADRRYTCNDNLHMDKVRRLGWDYASRGY